MSGDRALSTLDRDARSCPPGHTDGHPAASGLIVADDLLARIIDHLRRCLPHEGVGLLATVPSPCGLVAARFYPGRNIDASPRRYTMDPADVWHALRDMEKERTQLGAIVHSHPYTPPVPSRTDLDGVTLPAALSVIVGFEGRTDVRAWRHRFNRAGFAVASVEVQVEVRRCQPSPER